MQKKIVLGSRQFTNAWIMHISTPFTATFVANEGILIIVW
jgi:hypothetical protein